jgi:hypothetical protein
MKKSQHMSVLAEHFCTVCWGWCEAQQSLTPAVDWLDSLIGPRGLVLVVSHVFAVPVLVLWVELEKTKKLNLDVKNMFLKLVLLPFQTCNTFHEFSNHSFILIVTLRKIDKILIRMMSPTCRLPLLFCPQLMVRSFGASIVI